jgi:hypothetical protein
MMTSTKSFAKQIFSNTFSNILTQSLNPIHIITEQVQQLLNILKQRQKTSNSDIKINPFKKKNNKTKPRIRALKPDIKKVR